MASGKVKREELFVVTKLPLFAMRPEDVPVMFQRSLDDLGLEYIDLYLVHSPLGCEKDEETNHIKFVDGKVWQQQSNNNYHNSNRSRSSSSSSSNISSSNNNKCSTE